MFPSYTIIIESVLHDPIRSKFFEVILNLILTVDIAEVVNRNCFLL